ncbi:MAG TPA: hypothetical protein VFB59_03580 [Candidatus Saccharimonadales bacterium]|nr:hypothetical protein [Candidatus Saccharimonadales bacterium]
MPEFQQCPEAAVLEQVGVTPCGLENGPSRRCAAAAQILIEYSGVPLLKINERVENGDCPLLTLARISEGSNNMYLLETVRGLPKGPRQGGEL